FPRCRAGKSRASRENCRSRRPTGRRRCPNERPRRSGASFGNGDWSSPGLATVPVVDILAGLVLCVAIALLDFPFQLIEFAIDLVEVVVGQFAPLFLDLALDLFPVTFNAIPVHSVISSYFVDGDRTDETRKGSRRNRLCEHGGAR